MQALCFYAGANSVFYGEELLTAPNVEVEKDRQLFSNLGMKIEGDNGQIEKLNNTKPANINRKQDIHSLKLVN